MTWGDLEYKRRYLNTRNGVNANAEDYQRLYNAQRGSTYDHPYKTIADAMEMTRTIDDCLVAALSYLDKAANRANRINNGPLRARIEDLARPIAMLSDEFNAEKRRKQLEKAPGCIRVKESAT